MFHQSRQPELQPTYSFDEAFELIQTLDWQGLDIIDELIQEEEDRYELIEIQTLFWLIDLMYQKKTHETEGESL
jgi:hypothetical protein